MNHPLLRIASISLAAGALVGGVVGAVCYTQTGVEDVYQGNIIAAQAGVAFVVGSFLTALFLIIQAKYLSHKKLLVSGVLIVLGGLMFGFYCFFYGTPWEGDCISYYDKTGTELLSQECQ